LSIMWDKGVGLNGQNKSGGTEGAVTNGRCKRGGAKQALPMRRHKSSVAKVGQYKRGGA